MKKLFILFVLCLHLLFFNKAKAQSNGKLPWSYYMTMTNSCTSADIVLLQGEGGSMGVDKANMGIVKEFISDNAGGDITGSPSANIMCHINGQEFIMGHVYLLDNGGAVKFSVEGKEYTNRLSDKGFEFFRSVIASL